MEAAPRGSTGDSFDVLVIGAGVVGCAVARAFAIRGLSVLVAEKASDILEGASKGNSAILHTGFDEPSGSLELACVQRGYAEYRRIHERLNLPLLACSGLVVAWSEAEREQLCAVVACAQENGVTNAREIPAHELREREPHLSEAARGAVLIPGEAVIDPWSAPLAYLLQALAHGAEVRFSTEIARGTRTASGWRLETGAGPLHARLVVNCAGLYGDHVHAISGPPDFTIRPRKGQFVVFDKSAFPLVRSIILGVPSERTKGVLVAPTVFGNVLLGPTAEEQEDRERAATDRATLEALIARGAKIVPALRDAPITATYAGLRPATEHRDYRISASGERAWITIGGIRSTGLTAALGIAEHVVELAATMCGRPLPAPPLDDLDWPSVPNLAEGRARPWQAPGRSEIVCHCELVTRSEIEGALAGPLPAATLGGLKRRTRAMMGGCQGFHCGARVIALAGARLGLAAAPAPLHG
jgi:glycerol-3-phosphate dehydrogenase